MKLDEVRNLIDSKFANLAARISVHAEEDRGDVPGWVLVTVMTAGLVVAIWSVADGQLKSVLSSALRSVSKP